MRLDKGKDASDKMQTPSYENFHLVSLTAFHCLYLLNRCCYAVEMFRMCLLKRKKLISRDRCTGPSTYKTVAVWSRK